MGQGKARVKRYSTFVHLHGIFQVRPGAPATIASSPQVIIVGLRVFGGFASRLPLFLWRQCNAQSLRNTSRAFLLNGGDIVELPLEALGPDGVPCRGFHKLCGDADAVAGAADGAFEHVGGAELLAYLLRGNRLVAESEHLRTREYLELRDLRNLGDDVFRDAVAEIFVLFGAALVFEVEDRYGFWLGCCSMCSRTRTTFLGGGPAARFDIAAEALQIGAEFSSRLAPEVGVLLERLAKNVFQRQGQARIQFLCRCGRGMQDSVENHR